MKCLNYFFCLIFLCSVVSAVSYDVDRLNFPPGESKEHFHQIEFGGDLSIAIPDGFSVGSYSSGAFVNSTHILYSSLTATTFNYTLVSPSSCTENDIYRSTISINGSRVDELIYLCIPDIKVVDYKVEYGHGEACYLDELFIPNDSVTLFNLVRFFPLGHLFIPNENMKNVNIDCIYELLPVRTYGRTEVRRDDLASRINASYHWDEIEGGYWFRLGVLSQDLLNKQIGDTYDVGCGYFTADFSHEHVNASFSNYSLEVVSKQPFQLTQFNDTDPNKLILQIENIEKYTARDVTFAFIVNNDTREVHIPEVAPGDKYYFRIERMAKFNVRIFFTPPWFINCQNTKFIEQNKTIWPFNNPPVLDFIPTLYTKVNTSFTYDSNGSDPDGDVITFSTNSTFFNINSSDGKFGFYANDSLLGNHTIYEQVCDPFGECDWQVYLIIVTENRPPVITSTGPPGNFTMPAGTSRELRWNKTDPDNDNVTITWYWNGTQIKNGSDHYPYGNESHTLKTTVGMNGTVINITIYVDDGQFNDTFAWFIIVNESLPPVPTPTGTTYGGNGGHGGARKYLGRQYQPPTSTPTIIKTTEPEVCRSDWICTAWGPCIDGKQFRECGDYNNCPGGNGRPSEEQLCIPKEVEIINITFEESCYDGEQNQGETGIDCGGPCGPCANFTTYTGKVICGDSICSNGELCPEDCDVQGLHVTGAVSGPLSTGGSILMFILLGAGIYYVRKKGLKKLGYLGLGAMAATFLIQGLSGFSFLKTLFWFAILGIVIVAVWVTKPEFFDQEESGFGDEEEEI